MKINNSHPNLTQPGQVESRQNAQKAQNKDGAPQKGDDPAAMTHLSNAASDSRQDIDSLRVEELREAIREGRLDIRAERIADGLVSSVKDLLDSRDSKG